MHLERVPGKAKQKSYLARNACFSSSGTSLEVYVPVRNKSSEYRLFDLFQDLRFHEKVLLCHTSGLITVRISYVLKPDGKQCLDLVVEPPHYHPTAVYFGVYKTVAGRKPVSAEIKEHLPFRVHRVIKLFAPVPRGKTRFLPFGLPGKPLFYSQSFYSPGKVVAGYLLACYYV